MKKTNFSFHILYVMQKKEQANGLDYGFSEQRKWSINALNYKSW